MRSAFLEKSGEGQNQWWRYLLTIVMSIIFLFLGAAIPVFFIALVLKSTQISSFALLIILLLSLISLLGGLILGIKFIHKRTVISYITAHKDINWKEMAFSAGLWFALVSLLTLISYLIDPTSLIFTFNLNLFIVSLFICLLMVPLQVFAEELLFRGYLLQGFYNVVKRPWFPVAVTSLLFTLAHTTFLYSDVSAVINLTLYYLSFGIFAAVMTLLRNGIETAIGIHLATNLFGFLIVSAPSYGSSAVFTSTRDVSEFNIYDLLPFWVLIALFLFIFFKKYKPEPPQSTQFKRPM